MDLLRELSELPGGPPAINKVLATLTELVRREMVRRGGVRNGPDPDMDVFWWDGKAYRATHQTSQILRGLWGRRQRPKDEIAYALWPCGDDTADGLKSAIARTNRFLAQFKFTPRIRHRGKELILE